MAPPNQLLRPRSSALIQYQEIHPIFEQHHRTLPACTSVVLHGVSRFEDQDTDEPGRGRHKVEEIPIGKMVTAVGLGHGPRARPGRHMLYPGPVWRRPTAASERRHGRGTADPAAVRLMLRTPVCPCCERSVLVRLSSACACSGPCGPACCACPCCACSGCAPSCWVCGALV